MTAKPKHFEYLIHAVVFVILFITLCFFAEKTGSNYEINWTLFRRHGVILLLFAVLFYLNYYVLIPKLYTNKRRTLYFVVNLLIIIAITCLVQWLQPRGFLSHPPIEAPPPMMPDEPDLVPLEHIKAHTRLRNSQSLLPRRLLFFFRDVLFLTLSVVLALLVKMIVYVREMEIRNNELEAANTKAELQNLRSQLNPHFLLNTLNNIYALILVDTQTAQTAVIELSKLLRYVLYDNRAMFVPLVNEVAFLEHYIRLMQLRLTDNVVVKTRFDVTPDNCTQIAPQIFISLIENAFKHGVVPNAASLISIALSDNAAGDVNCMIINTNHPKNKKDKGGSGIGLEQVRRRLDLLYPDRYEWSITYSDDQTLYKSNLIIRTKS
ncbi:MAG: sensor histidine kinase [Paludibacteraceae bacterium]